MLLRMWVRKEGDVPLFLQWWPEWESDADVIPSEFTVRLEKGRSIGGVVTDTEGKPISGVKVEVRRVDRAGEFSVGKVEKGKRPLVCIWLAEDDSSNVHRPRVTDANGRWALDNVPPGSDVEVLVKLRHP